jgi:hypothetical protein
MDRPAFVVQEFSVEAHIHRPLLFATSKAWSLQMRSCSTSLAEGDPRFRLAQESERQMIARGRVRRSIKFAVGF